MCIHRKHLPTTCEREGNRSGFDPDAFVLTQKFQCRLRFHVVEERQREFALFGF